MRDIMPGAVERALICSVALLLLWLGLFPAQASGGRETRNEVHFQVHQDIIVPQWKADGDVGKDKHPPRAEVSITAEGRNLILDIEKNELLFTPNYTETHYTKSGTPHSLTLNHSNHCFYHGVVRGVEDSSVALSACSGLRGLIVLRNNLSYILEPLPHRQLQHLIYRSEHFKFPKGACGSEHSRSKTTDWLTDLTGPAEPNYHRVKRDDEQSMKYVELLLVADYAEFYKSLNIRIALVGLEVWNNHNKCEISANPHSTLWSFLAWRRKLLMYKKHDNAQLITGTAFHGSTIGLAPLMAMCSVYQSGGVNMLISPGTLCRELSRPCDLPEYCTGKSPFCPANVYQLDGTPCAKGRAYCYSGMCLTYEQQCLQLWGNGAQPAPDTCFERVNAAGDPYGNCGKDVNGRYKKCETRDAKCGKIQCQSSASKPLEFNAVAIDTTITLNGRKIRCRGTHVYRNEEEVGDMLDPGLVMAGTKCGDSHICFEGHCQNTSFLDTGGDCERKCNGQGVCNNNQNCHCFGGWAPPFCNKPGYGGSLDSGPMPQESAVPIIAGVLISVLILTALGIAFCCYKWRARLGPLKKFIIPPKNIPQFSTSPPEWCECQSRLQAENSTET
ncbi:disintegrin and metalloproteinase domain-containing protein 19 isoform X3 [Paroedura picta]|uniref:disintegrin and metalloproteinase domain-containing protein 19 isoform X3 n=1 Tax=Paroedura picta TaxID=143630 RepID=UPI004057784F